MNNQEIIDYYNDCKIDYRLLWRLDKVWGMHFGYFEKGDKSLSRAILKMNQQVIDRAEIKSNYRVLDAGCGFAGTAMYIAENLKCKIDAITIVDDQVETARKVIKSKKLDKYISVSKQDFTKTTFENNSFDVIYAIESVCHAHDKRKFLSEAFRLLKPGGKLIIFDGYNSKEKTEYADDEVKIMKNWNKGWTVESLESSEYFIKNSKDIGFVKQNFDDISEYVIKTSRIMYASSFPALAIDFIGRILKKRSNLNKGNVIAAKYQYIGLRRKLWKYGVFIAEKK